MPDRAEILATATYISNRYGLLAVAIHCLVVVLAFIFGGAGGRRGNRQLVDARPARIRRCLAALATNPFTCSVRLALIGNEPTNAPNAAVKLP